MKEERAGPGTPFKHLPSFSLSLSLVCIVLCVLIPREPGYKVGKPDKKARPLSSNEFTNAFLSQYAGRCNPLCCSRGATKCFHCQDLWFAATSFPLSKDYRLIDRLHQNESGSILGYCAEYSISAHVAKVPFPEFLG